MLHILESQLIILCKQNKGWIFIRILFPDFVCYLLAYWFCVFLRYIQTRLKAPKQTSAHKINLLIDIQAKLQVGKGQGYEQGARVFNLKQMAQTLYFWEENGQLKYALLEARAKDSMAWFNELFGTLRRAERRMSKIAALQKQIVNYSRTLEVYAAYRNDCSFMRLKYLSIAKLP